MLTKYSLIEIDFNIIDSWKKKHFLKLDGMGPCRNHEACLQKHLDSKISKNCRRSSCKPFQKGQFNSQTNIPQHAKTTRTRSYPLNHHMIWEHSRNGRNTYSLTPPSSLWFPRYWPIQRGNYRCRTSLDWPVTRDTLPEGESQWKDSQGVKQQLTPSILWHLPNHRPGIPMFIKYT